MKKFSEFISESLVRWESSGESGFWESKDKRFYITPRYYGRTTAQDYEIRDTKTKETHSGTRIKDVKWWAELQLQREKK